MGISSYLTQLAFVAIYLIITNLCPVITVDETSPNTKNEITPTATWTTDLGSTNGTSAESTTDASISTALPTTNSTITPTWISGYVVFCGVGVLALLVLLVMVSVVSITIDRLNSGREQGTVTLNRMDRIGTQLQRMSPGLRLELQSDGSIEDGPVQMMPEQAMSEPVQPASADQTNLLLIEDDAPTVSHCVENKAANGHYEECKFARASAESLDLLMDMSDLDEAKVAINSTYDANALRYRSYSADPSRSTNQQMPTIRLYSNPERNRKCRDNQQDAPADTLSDISTTGMDDLRVTDCSATPFDREESVDMYGADSPSSADCKNESFIHSPSASSAVVAYHKKMEKPANDPPRNTLPSGPHVYEELKDMRSVNEATTSKESGAASRHDLCKITFPQYFQINDRAVEDARAAAGYTKPRTAQTLPRQDVPNSLALLTTSFQDELADGGNNMSSVRARRGTGILAAINQQHRLSDGALDRAQQVHEVNTYSSLQRQNVPSMKPYSKLKRGPSATVSSPKAPSKNVYDKLKLADDSEVTGQAIQLNETTRL